MNTLERNSQEPGTSRVPRARVLIVDDETAQMTALCHTLRDQGYDTTGFNSPAEALDMLATANDQKFELVLTDLMMPGMDGIQFLQKAQQFDPQLIGIVMTGQGTIETAVKAMQCGAMDYILKPFKLSVILPVLSRALAIRQLRLQNLELERCVARRNAELEEANRELESFSYSVSHDLRAPLRAIEGFTKIVLGHHSTGMSEEARKLLAHVEKSTQHMGRLIDDLLRLSRLNRQHLSLSPVDMTRLVQEVWEQLPKARTDGRAIELHVGELPIVTGDLSLLRQVMVNLLSNAVKFTGQTAEPRVEVTSRPGDSESIFCVRDNGAGFDMQYAGKLFGVFQRLHSQEQFEGTGVGLSIVQRVIVRHGGRIWAEGKENEGASFFFSLPLRKNKA